MIIIRDGAPFTRLELVQYLESKKIATRSLFAGNLLKHPAYMGRKDILVVGTLKNAYIIMNNGFWIGVYRGITRAMLDYVEEQLNIFFHRYH